MARNYYQYDTNPRKIQTEEQMPRKNKTRKKSGLKVVKEMQKQQVEGIKCLKKRKM